MAIYYAEIRRWRKSERKKRTLERLLALRKALAPMRARKRPETLLLATWNIRDFDSNKFGHGKRLPESFHYIAEIISTFDLVAVQEVNRDLAGLKSVMKLLGPKWNYIVTDTTEGSSGNAERMAFLYDRGKISFRHVAGEIVLPKPRKTVSRKDIEAGKQESDSLQFARTPFMVAFQAGWFKFNLSTVHIYYGSPTGKKLKRRIKEINDIAAFFKKRQKKENEDYILLGDFNIVSPEHETMQALEKNQFIIPEGLKKHATNLDGSMHYDQIALCVQENRLEIGECGIIRIFSEVFRDNGEDFSAYRKHFKAQFKTGDEAEEKRYYQKKWRTFQMSDHMPLWLELKTDFSDAYLQKHLDQA